MKKFFILLLAFTMTLSIASCHIPPEDTHTSGTDTAILPSPPKGFVSPADEISATKTFTASNEDGLVMEITLHGYASESLGEEFYVKSNEYFRAHVKITNTADQMYQQTTVACHGDTLSHNHELKIDITDGNEHALVLSSFGFMHPDLLRPWIFREKSTEEWHLKLAAGEECIVDMKTDAEKVAEIDLPSDGQDELPLCATGVALYDRNIYTNDALMFSGTISFPYAIFSGSSESNDKTLSCPLAVKVMYVPFEK